jgi:hypothetical protein
MTIGTFFPLYNISAGAAERIQEFLKLESENTLMPNANTNSILHGQSIIQNINIDESQPIIQFNLIKYHLNQTDYSTQSMPINLINKV